MNRSIALAYAITGLAVATAIGAIVAATTGLLSPSEPGAAAVEATSLAPASPGVASPNGGDDGSAIVVVEPPRKRRKHEEHERREHRRRGEEDDDD